MAVLLPNTSLGLRRVGADTTDAHGDDWGAPAYDPPVGPWPGRAPGGGADLQGGEEVHPLALDEQAWPARPRDVVVEYDQDGQPTGREWTLRVADVIRHSVDPSVNYVRCQGHLRVEGSSLP